MNLVPVKNKVAIVRLKNKLETDSGIVLTKAVGDVDKATVFAVGPDVKDVVIGNIVLVDWNKTTTTKLGDVPIYIIKEDDIVAIFDQPA